jgi:tetratricopeptide (TPR) repeat protein
MNGCINFNKVGRGVPAKPSERIAHPEGSPYLRNYCYLRGSNFILLVLFIIPLLVSGCGSPRVVQRPDAEIERNAAAARTAYAGGATESAARFYQKALNRARLADQPVEISRLAYNLAVCRVRSHNYGEALKLLDEAQYEADKTSVDFQEIRLLRAEIFRNQGKTNEAFTVAKSGMETAKKNDIARLQLCLVLAELACDKHDDKQALKELDKIDKDLLKATDSATQAREANIRGRALLMEKKNAEAAVCFDDAAKLYQGVQRYAEMGDCLFNAGKNYEACGKQALAFNRYYRATRTLILCGDTKKAQEALGKANELVKEESDREMLKLLSQLQPAPYSNIATNPLVP